MRRKLLGKKKIISYITAFSLSLVTLSGCASLNNKNTYTPKSRIDNVNVAKIYLQPKEPKKVVKVNFSPNIPNPVKISSKVADIRISDLEFDGTLKELTNAIFSARHIKCFLSSDVTNIPINIPYFQGTVGDLMRLLSQNYGIIVTERNGIINIKKDSEFSISLMTLPSNLQKEIIKQMSSTGLFQKLYYSPYTQQITWKGNAKSVYQLKKILSNVLKNYARIDFDVVVFETTYQYDKVFSLGIKGAIRPNGGHIGGGSARMNLSMNISSGSTTVTATSNGSNIFSSTLNVGDFNDVLKAIYDKGSGAIIQKLFLSTANLSTAKIEEGEKQPYIEKITQTYVNTLNNSGTVPQTSVDFNDALSGISLEIKPLFLSRLDSVYTRININIQDVQRMVQVKAGSDEYTRPVTTTRNIESSLIMQLGEVYIFGGFAISRNSKLYSYLPVKISKTNNTVYLFFAIRPTVVVYEDTEGRWMRSASADSSKVSKSNNEKDNTVIISDSLDKFISNVQAKRYLDAYRIYTKYLKYKKIEIIPDKYRYSFFMSLGNLYRDYKKKYFASYKLFFKAYTLAQRMPEKVSALKECLKVAKVLNDNDLKCSTYILLGDLMESNGNRIEALKYYYAAKNIKKTNAILEKIVDVMQKMNSKELAEAVRMKVNYKF